MKSQKLRQVYDTVKRIIVDVVLGFLGAVILLFIWPIRNKRRGTDTIGADFDKAREGAKELEERIGDTSESVERSRQLSESALADNSSARDIIKKIRERANTVEAGND